MPRTRTTFKKGNEQAFKEGPDPRRNAGGKPKGAQLSSAFLRALAKVIGRKRGGYERTVADAIADELCRRARSRKAKDAVRASTELRKATEGEHVHVGPDDATLKGLTLEELLQLRAAKMTERKDAGQPGSARTRKRN